MILVEDDDTAAMLTEMYFSKTGFSDDVDRTYRIKPFEHLINFKKYDVAIVDYHLQCFDAPTFIRIIKTSRLNANTPIIVISHELSLEEEREVNALGVHYIRRPDDYMVFVSLISKTLRDMN